MSSDSDNEISDMDIDSDEEGSFDDAASVNEGPPTPEDFDLERLNQLNHCVNLDILRYRMDELDRTISQMASLLYDIMRRCNYEKVPSLDDFSDIEDIDLTDQPGSSPENIIEEIDPSIQPGTSSENIIEENDPSIQPETSSENKIEDVDSNIQPETSSEENKKI